MRVRRSSGRQTAGQGGREEGADRTIEILDAAADCFMESGFDAATIDDIADRLDSTKGLIYYKFKSKIDLFFAVYQRGIELARDTVQPHARSGLEPLARLKAMAIAHTLLLMRTLSYHHVIKQAVDVHVDRALTPQQRGALRQLTSLRAGYERLFAHVIEECAREGSLLVPNLDICTKTLMGGLDSVSNWYRPKANEMDVDRLFIAEAVANQVIFGLDSKADLPKSEASYVRFQESR